MEILQYAHSWLLWVVLILGLVVVVKSILGWQGSRPYLSADRGLASGFLGTIHLQLVLGLILYFIGDKGLALIQANGMGAVMKDSTLRFWAVEHITTMIIAVVVATIGSSKVKRASEPTRKHKQAALFFGIALLLILSRVPWSQVPLFKGIS